MKPNMYFLNSKSLIIDAIEFIEYNKSRCVIIVNSSNKVIGVLSEGDIIRLLLNKVNLNSPLKNVINKFESPNTLSIFHFNTYLGILTCNERIQFLQFVTEII